MINSVAFTFICSNLYSSINCCFSFASSASDVFVCLGFAMKFTALFALSFAFLDGFEGMLLLGLDRGDDTAVVLVLSF